MTASRPRSAVGESLHIHGEAVDHCEALYLEYAGEVTTEVEQAEAARDVAGREALEALARYRLWLDDQRANVERERARLSDLVARLDKRQAWADEKAAALMETVAPERTRATVGTHTVKLQRTVAVETTADLDLSQCPSAWIRDVPEKVIPASRALDKTNAKADLLLDYREGEPPCAGWYDVEGHGRVWLWYSDDGPTPSTWAIGRGPEDRIVAPSLASAGLSIEPTPGLDVLRWKPAPPGVKLVRRVHVKVD